MANIYPVVMAGGVGSRLWPLSREGYPKQLLGLLEPDKTLLQTTFERLQGCDLSFGEPWVVCNDDHRFLVAEQLRPYGVGVERIILEPVGRNTAPTVALAAFEVLQEDPEGIILVLAADHYVAEVQRFHEALIGAYKAAVRDCLVTFGIQPTHPETGYGYIEQGPLWDNRLSDCIFKVNAFKEKPNDQVAEAFVESNKHYWNSGMFMMSAQGYLEDLKRYAPKVYDASLQAIKQAKRSYGYIQVAKEAFVESPDISIDYAVMEHTTKAVMIKMAAKWSDVGSWKSLWDLGEKDANHNVLIGDVKTVHSNRNYIRTDKHLVAAIGVEDLLIVNTADALLVAHKDQAQSIKQIVSELKELGRREAFVHLTDFRPWGHYSTIDESERFKAKRIVVQPGAKLSLQKHHHRAEHWVVVKGTALVRCGEKTFLLSENESTFIPLGQTHQLSNPGKIPLEIIEVQSGAYLGEDDIERMDDAYGRE